MTATETPRFNLEIGDSGTAVDIEREESGGEEIHEPFDPEKIDVATRTPTVSLLLSRIRRKTIDLAPDFQRNAGIWKDVAQSRLIESLLLRIPLPTFYAAENPDESWSIVDGIQRLTSITRFMDPKSIGADQLRLRGMEYLEAYNGHRFEDLPGRLQTRLEETEVVLHLIRQGTPEEVKFNIFARINTGGLPLTSQELRHALIPGKARDLLTTLANSPEFIQATVGSVGRSRMADREMVLRFLAFLQTGPESYQFQDFDLFLREAMRSINRLDDTETDTLGDHFRQSMITAWEIFGPYAFRKQYAEDAARNPVNKALFEAVSVSLARRSPQARKRLVASKKRVNLAFIRLMNDDALFNDSVSVGTGDVTKVQHRFHAIAKLFDSIGGKN